MNASSNSGSTDSGLRSAAWRASAAAGPSLPSEARSAARSSACAARTGCSAVQQIVSASTTTASAATAVAGSGRHQRARRRCRLLARPPGARAAARARRPSRRTAAPPTALPGTNHVQSISEWNANTSTTVAIVSSPIRSGSYGSPRSRRRSPVARDRRHDPRERAEQRHAEPDQPEVGERLHAVAVGVPDSTRAGAGSACARPRRRPRRRRPAFESLVDLAAPPASSARAPRTSRSGGPACWPASRAFGSVSFFHAFETWPSMPPGAAASAITTASTARARARPPAPRPPAAACAASADAGRPRS